MISHVQVAPTRHTRGLFRQSGDHISLAQLVSELPQSKPVVLRIVLGIQLVPLPNEAYLHDRFYTGTRPVEREAGWLGWIERNAGWVEWIERDVG